MTPPVTYLPLYRCILPLPTPNITLSRSLFSALPFWQRTLSPPLRYRSRLSYRLTTAARGGGVATALPCGRYNVRHGNGDRPPLSCLIHMPSYLLERATRISVFRPYGGGRRRAASCNNMRACRNNSVEHRRWTRNDLTRVSA